MASVNRRKWIKGSLISISSMALSERMLAISNKRQASTSNTSVVINAGISGNNTINLLARLDTDCLAHYPELTVLMVGTNDMNSQKYVPLQQYQQNLNLIINKLKAVGSQVILLTILPFYEPYLLTRHPAAFYQPEGVTTRRKQLNDAIIAIAKQQNIHLLDTGRRFEVLGKAGLDKDSLFQNEANSNKTDGVHPTPTGYRFLALSVYDYVTDRNLPTGKIVCLGDSITYGYGAANTESYPACLLNLLRSED